MLLFEMCFQHLCTRGGRGNKPLWKWVNKVKLSDCVATWLAVGVMTGGRVLKKTVEVVAGVRDGPAGKPIDLGMLRSEGEVKL